MKFKYRMISEERCKEIDGWEIHDPYGYGKKLSTHGKYWVANEDESILFCHAFMARHDDMEGNHEAHLFVKGKEHYLVNYIVEHIEVIDEYSWIVYVNILEQEFINISFNEVMCILKKVISIIIKKHRRETPGEHFEYHFYYKGQEV